MVDENEFIGWAAGLDVMKPEEVGSTDLQIIVELCKKVIELEERLKKLEKKVK